MLGVVRAYEVDDLIPGIHDVCEIPLPAPARNNRDSDFDVDNWKRLILVVKNDGGLGYEAIGGSDLPDGRVERLPYDPFNRGDENVVTGILSNLLHNEFCEEILPVGRLRQNVARRIGSPVPEFHPDRAIIQAGGMPD